MISVIECQVLSTELDLIVNSFEFIDDAEDELIYMTVDELLTDEHLDHLEAANERSVDIYLVGISEPIQAQIQERIPANSSLIGITHRHNSEVTKYRDHIEIRGLSE